MLINTRNTPVPPDDTTMIIMRGARKAIDPEKKRDMARRCGIECIKLRWKGRLTSTIGTSGFQPVYIMNQPAVSGGVDSVARWAVNEFTNKPLAERSMDFIPDELDVGFAYLPDGPYNRVHLAYAEIAGNAPWEIDDPEVKKNILDLADEIKKSTEFRMEMEELDSKKTEVKIRVQEMGISIGEAVKSRIELQNTVLEEKIRELEQAELREKNLKRIAELQARVGGGVTSASTEQVKVDAQPVPKKATSVSDAKVLRDRAKAEVYSENHELLDSVKASHMKATGSTKGWAFGPEWRSKIEPLIEKRIKEITESEHATAGGIT